MSRMVKLGTPDPVWKEMIRTGDWSLRVWFLDPQEVERLRNWGFEKGELEAAVEAFKKVYPPGIAKALLDNDWHPDKSTSLDNYWQKEDAHKLVSGLFGNIALLVPPVSFLGLGVDLARVFEGGFDRDLADRLRDPAKASGADLEVQVWANALRAGWNVTKIDIPEAGTGRRQDLLVKISEGLAVTVEVKSLDAGDDVVLASRLHVDNVFSFQCNCVPTDRQVHIQSGQDLYEAAATPALHAWFKERVPGMAQSFRAAIKRLEDDGYPLGEHSVDGAGVISVVPAEETFGGSTSISLTGEKPPEKQAERAIRPLWRAAQKPRRDGLPNIAFIDLPRLHESLVVQAVEEEIARRPSEYGNLDGFIYRTVREVREDGLLPFQQWRAWTKTMSGRISPQDLDRLALGLIRSPRRLTMPESVVRRMPFDSSKEFG